MTEHNIRVNSVLPGITKTPLYYEGIRRSEDFARQMKEREQMIPLGRAAKPEEIADVVAFLASSESDYMTGQAISVDGGATM